MGPRFCKRGNRIHRQRLRPGRQLQWGHAFVSVETQMAVVRTGVMGKALQWGHAFVSVETVVSQDAPAEAVTASMGPRFCKRGNKKDVLRELPAKIRLQWGHAFVSVET